MRQYPRRYQAKSGREVVVGLGEGVQQQQQVCYGVQYHLLAQLQDLQLEQILIPIFEPGNPHLHFHQVQQPQIHY